MLSVGLNSLPYICVQQFARHLDNPIPENINAEYIKLKKNKKEPIFLEKATIAQYICAGLLGAGILSGLYGLFKEAKGFIFTGIASSLLGIGCFIYGLMNGVDYSDSSPINTTSVSVNNIQGVNTTSTIPKSPEDPLAETFTSYPRDTDITNNITHSDLGLLPDKPLVTDTIHASRPSVNNVESEFKEKLNTIGEIRLLSEQIPTEDFLKQSLPMPKYKITLNGSTYFLSEPFLDSNWDRPSFNLYLVQKDPYSRQDSIFARAVYKSNSQSLWRIASHTSWNVDWIGKGWGEVTTNVPMEIQPQLEKILENYNWELKENGALEKVLVRLGQIPPKTFVIPQTIPLGEFRDKNNPTSFKYNDENDAPDFTRIVDIYRSKNNVYGDFRSYIIESKNKNFKYLFNVANVDNKQMVWIGGIQYTYNDLNTYGVVKKPVSVHSNFLLPAYEYWRQIPEDYDGNRHPKDTSYYDATSFTHNLPPVKEFIEQVLSEITHNGIIS